MGSNAFPYEALKWKNGIQQVTVYPGLTKREYFAGLAMQGLCADPEVGKFPDADALPGIAARRAIEFADALLEELGREESDEN